MPPVVQSANPVNLDTLDPVVDIQDVSVYQPTRPLVTNLASPGSTGDLINKLAQLGARTGGSQAGATAVFSRSYGGGAGGGGGAAGKAGAAGAVGPAGPPGPAGPAGTSGTDLSWFYW
jgi:hypothetical protein